MSTVPSEKPETLRVRSVVDATIRGGGGLMDGLIDGSGHYTKISLSRVLLSFSDMWCVLLFLSFDIFQGSAR